MTVCGRICLVGLCAGPLLTDSILCYFLFGQFSDSLISDFDSVSFSDPRREGPMLSPKTVGCVCIPIIISSLSTLGTAVGRVICSLHFIYSS